MEPTSVPVRQREPERESRQEDAAPSRDEQTAPVAPCPLPAGCAPDGDDGRTAPPAAAPLERLHRLPAGDPGHVIRRDLAWGPTNHADTSLDKWTDRVDDLVKEGAQVALTKYNDLTGTDGYTARWKETAARLMAFRGNPQPGTSVKFGAARYGYAVEAHTLARLQKIQSELPTGFNWSAQVGKGSTRPDIVVTDPQQHDVGWFDITSKASRGHIYRKSGSQWKTRPFVAELLYDNFDLSRLAPGNTSAADQLIAQQSYLDQQAAWKATLAGWRSDFDEAFRTASTEAAQAKGGGLNASEWQAAARQALCDCFDLTEIKPLQCKNLLRALDLLPKNYGFGDGGSKQAGIAFLRSIDTGEDETMDEAETEDIEPQ